jgi:hypothetical protein
MTASLAARAKRSVCTPCDFDGAIDDPPVDKVGASFDFRVAHDRIRLGGRAWPAPIFGDPLAVFCLGRADDRLAPFEERLRHVERPQSIEARDRDSHPPLHVHPDAPAMWPDRRPAWWKGRTI